MRWVELIVYGTLGILALASVWIIYRAIAGKGAWWALKGILLVVFLAGLVFGGLYLWFRHMEKVPADITPELIGAAHTPLLDAMRRLALEKDLEDLAVLQSGETDWDDLAEAFRRFGENPDLLLASILLPSGSGVPIYGRPDLKGGHMFLEANLRTHDSPPRVTRGIIGVGRWSIIHTLEYSEPAEDSSGGPVRLCLTIRPDGLERN